ncbi:MAG: hypothetical protein U1E40_10575 [Amaricoccus sp.]
MTAAVLYMAITLVVVLLFRALEARCLRHLELRWPPAGAGYRAKVK